MKNKLFNDTLSRLADGLTTLADKPEETPEATLKALWFAAYGEPKSAQLACECDLPELSGEQQNILCEFVEKRLQGVPLAHITGRQRFLDLELWTSPQALIPRKETELLGRAALQILDTVLERKNHVRVIDVCTGAGNLAIACASHKSTVRVYAADLSSDAVALAKKNVLFHNLQDFVEVKEGNLLDPFEHDGFYNSIDLITCNPPYISSAKVETMHSEISHYEPRLAFDGGPFGIKILNKLIQQAPQYLKKGGWLAFEVGLGQGPSMLKVIDKCGKYSDVQPVSDTNGDIRAISARI